MPDSDTPVMDTLALMTAASLENSDLPPREFMIARIAALAAVDAPAASYALNVGPAADSGITLGLGLVIALAEAELEAELAEAEAESAEDGEETTTMP